MSSAHSVPNRKKMKKIVNGTLSPWTSQHCMFPSPLGTCFLTCLDTSSTCNFSQDALFIT